MKILKIFLVLALLVTFVPFSGYCSDAHDDHAEQCAMDCHTLCCQSGMIVPGETEHKTNLISFTLIPSEYSDHQDPALIVRHRPPIVLS